MSTMRVHLLVLIAVVSAACVEHKCPKGYREEGDTCYRIKDGGLEGGTDQLDADVSPVEADAAVAVDADGATSPSKADGAPAQDADVPGELEASTEEDANAPDIGPAGPCQGSSGKSVCVGAVMHHCSATGKSERTEECASDQQCQSGASFQACAPCLKGKFQCKDTRLERCSADGQRWELADTCDSAALCNETAGACTDKACTASTRICDDDVLTGCNASLTALQPLKTCKPGLCDQAEGECDVCVANAKACEQDTVVACDANGRRETRVPCPAETPKCTGSGTCVECVRNTDCTGAHELCTGNRCVVQPYCGDGKKDAAEECDPLAAGQNVWTCNAECKRTMSYLWCAANVEDVQGNPQGIGCAAGEACLYGACAAKCDLPGDCPPSPVGTAFCPTTHLCVTSCSDSSQCAPGLVCSSNKICIGCADSRPCPTGTTCKLASANDDFRKCLP